MFSAHSIQFPHSFDLPCKVITRNLYVLDIEEQTRDHLTLKHIISLVHISTLIEEWNLKAYTVYQNTLVKFRSMHGWLLSEATYNIQQ